MGVGEPHCGRSRRCCDEFGFEINGTTAYVDTHTQACFKFSTCEMCCSCFIFTLRLYLYFRNPESVFVASCVCVHKLRLCPFISIHRCIKKSLWHFGHACEWIALQLTILAGSSQSPSRQSTRLVHSRTLHLQLAWHRSMRRSRSGSLTSR